METNESYDPGAAELASAIAERIQCLAVSPNFSKLLIDPSLPIQSHNIVKLAFNSEVINYITEE